jgi:hypothetical protein
MNTHILREEKKIKKYCKLHHSRWRIAVAGENLEKKYLEISPDLIIRYLRSRKKNRHKKLVSKNMEKILCSDISSMYDYAVYVLDKILPKEMHQLMVMKSFDSSLSNEDKRLIKRYLDFAAEKYAESVTSMDQY